MSPLWEDLYLFLTSVENEKEETKDKFDTDQRHVQRIVIYYYVDITFTYGKDDGCAKNWNGRI